MADKNRYGTFGEFTTEQRRENGRKGGFARAEANRKRKAMKETLEILMALPLKGGVKADIEKVKNFASLNGKNITVDEAILIKAVQRALKGDLTAIAFIRDTIGEKPTDNLNVTEVKPVIITGEDELDE